MLIRITRLLITLLGLLVGYRVSHWLIPLINPSFVSWTPLVAVVMDILGALLFGLIFFVIAPGLMNQIGRLASAVEAYLQRIPTQDIVMGTGGLVIGLIVANLLSFALWGIPYVGPYLPIASNLLFGYLGISVALKKRDDLGNIFSVSARSSRASRRESAARGDASRDIYKVLDTSVIIDGRIADVVKAGFLEGILVVPTFVLEELRHIADSSDTLRRNRGRRGLDILHQIQKQLGTRVQITEKDYEDIPEVDSRLIKLAQELKGKVLTTDYNLNKVCELHGVPVLNINDLANAVKPVVLPGEEMVIQVIKEGKEVNQGIAYLDDGTMIVVDNGKKHIGEHLKVVVTSVLQTSAGRMIFARAR
ncbi:MAG: PIN/TRAM domain-containing protein [Bacillota bacterium]|jgi:uncharacterized protein YacL